MAAIRNLLNMRNHRISKFAGKSVAFSLFIFQELVYDELYVNTMLKSSLTEVSCKKEHF